MNLNKIFLIVEHHSSWDSRIPEDGTVACETYEDCIAYLNYKGYDYDDPTSKIFFFEFTDTGETGKIMEIPIWRKP